MLIFTSNYLYTDDCVYIKRNEVNRLSSFKSRNNVCLSTEDIKCFFDNKLKAKNIY